MEWDEWAGQAGPCSTDTMCRGEACSAWIAELTAWNSVLVRPCWSDIGQPDGLRRHSPRRRTTSSMGLKVTLPAGITLPTPLPSAPKRTSIKRELGDRRAEIARGLAGTPVLISATMIRRPAGVVISCGELDVVCTTEARSDAGRLQPGAEDEADAPFDHLQAIEQTSGAVVRIDRRRRCRGALRRSTSARSRCPPGPHAP